MKLDLYLQGCKFDAVMNVYFRNTNNLTILCYKWVVICVQ